MKTLVIIIGVAIMPMVYGFDINRLQTYNANLKKCAEELGGSVSEPTAAIIVCVATKDGRVLNAEGLFIKKELWKSIEDVISDPSNLDQARPIFNKCYDEMIQSGVATDEQTIKIAQCLLSLLPLVHKYN